MQGFLALLWTKDFPWKAHEVGPFLSWMRLVQGFPGAALDFIDEERDINTYMYSHIH